MSTIQSVFDALHKHMLVSDIVGIHAAVKELSKHVDPILSCGHCHGRRLPLAKVYELTARFPKQRKALTALLINAKLLHPSIPLNNEVQPPDFLELWCGIRHQRSDWVRWWIHYLPLQGCTLSVHDARLLVNGSALNHDDSTFVFMGPSALPPTFPHALASVVARAPPPFQEIILHDLARRGVILRQDVSFFTAAALAEAQLQKVRRRLENQPDSGDVLKAAVTAAADLAEGLVVNAPSIADSSTYGMLRVHPHDVALPSSAAVLPATSFDNNCSTDAFLRAASIGFAPVDFTKVALRLTRAGLLFMQKNDRESLLYSEFLDGSHEQIQLFDDAHKLKAAKNAFTRNALLQSLVPFGTYTPFHKFMVRYLSHSGLGNVALVYRAWYRLPTLKSMAHTDELVDVKYKRLLAYVLEPEKQKVLFSAFEHQPLYIPLQKYNEVDNMFFCFYPSDYKGLFHSYSPQKPVCMFSLLEDIGYQFNYMLARVRDRKHMYSQTDIATFIECFQKLSCFWLTRLAPLHGVMAVLNVAVKLAYRLLSQQRAAVEAGEVSDDEVDHMLVHTLCYRLCSAAAEMAIRNFDPYKSMLAAKERARLAGASARNALEELLHTEEDEEEEEDIMMSVRPKLVMNKSQLSVQKATIVIDLPSYDGLSRYDPAQCLNWLEAFIRFNNAVHAFMLIVESFDLKERMRLGYRRPPAFLQDSADDEDAEVDMQGRSNSLVRLVRRHSMARRASNARRNTLRRKSSASASALRTAENERGKADNHVFSLSLSLVMIAIEWIFQNQMPHSVETIVATVENANAIGVTNYHPWILPYVPSGHSLPELASTALGQGLERMRRWANASDQGLPWPDMDDVHEQPATSELSWLIRNLISVYLASAAYYKLPVVGAAPPFKPRGLNVLHTPSSDTLSSKPLPAHVLRVITALCLLFYVPLPAELNAWWLCTPVLDLDVHEYQRTRTRNKAWIERAQREGIPLTQLDMDHSVQLQAQHELTELATDLLHVGVQPSSWLAQILVLPPRPEAIMTAPNPDVLLALETISPADDDALAGEPKPASLSSVTVVERVLQHVSVYTHREQVWLAHLLFATPPKDRSRGLPLQTIMDLVTKPSGYLFGWADMRDRALAAKMQLPALDVLIPAADGSTTKNPLYAGLGESNALRLQALTTLLLTYISTGQYNMLRAVCSVCFPEDPLCQLALFISAAQRRKYTTPPMAADISAFCETSASSSAVWVRLAQNQFLAEAYRQALGSKAFAKTDDDVKLDTVCGFDYGLDGLGCLTGKVAPELEKDTSASGVLTAAKGSHGPLQEFAKWGMDDDCPVEVACLKLVVTLKQQEKAVDEYNAYRAKLQSGKAGVYLPVRDAIVKTPEGEKIWCGQHAWSRAVCALLWQRFVEQQMQQGQLNQYDRRYLETVLSTYGWHDGLHALSACEGGLLSISPAVINANTALPAGMPAPSPASDRVVPCAVSQAGELAYVSLLQEVDATAVMEAVSGPDTSRRAALIDAALDQLTRHKAHISLCAALFYQCAAVLMRKTALPPVDAAVSQRAQRNVPYQALFNKQEEEEPLVGRARRQHIAETVLAVKDESGYAMCWSSDDMATDAQDYQESMISPELYANHAKQRRDNALQVVRALCLASLYWRAMLADDKIAKMKYRAQHLEHATDAEVPDTLTKIERSNISAASRRCSARALWLMEVFDIYSVKLAQDKYFREVNMPVTHQQPVEVIQDIIYKHHPAQTPAEVAGTEDNGPDANLGDPVADGMVVVTRAWLQQEYENDVKSTKTVLAKLLTTHARDADKAPLCLQKRNVLTMPLFSAGMEVFPLLGEKERVPWGLQRATKRMDLARQQLLQRRAHYGQTAPDAATQEYESSVLRGVLEKEGIHLFDDAFYSDESDMCVALAITTIVHAFQRSHWRTATSLLAEIQRRPATDPFRAAIAGHALLMSYAHLCRLLLFIADPATAAIENKGGRRALGAEMTRITWPTIADVHTRVKEPTDDQREEWWRESAEEGKKDIFVDVNIQKAIFWLHGGWRYDDSVALNVNVSLNGTADADGTQAVSVSAGSNTATTTGSDASVLDAVSRALRSTWTRASQVNLFPAAFATPATPDVGPEGEYTNCFKSACGHARFEDAGQIVDWLFHIGTKARLFLLDHLAATLQQLVTPHCTIARAVFVPPSSFAANEPYTHVAQLLRHAHVPSNGLTNAYSLNPHSSSIEATSASLPVSSVVSNAAHALFFTVAQAATFLHTARSLAHAHETLLLQNNIRSHFASVPVTRQTLPNSSPAIVSTVPSPSHLARASHFVAMCGLLSVRARPIALAIDKPSTIPILLHLSKCLELSVLTLLGAHPAQLFAQILARNHTHTFTNAHKRPGVASSKPSLVSGWALLTELFATGQAQILIRHHYHTQRYHTMMSALNHVLAHPHAPKGATKPTNYSAQTGAAAVHGAVLGAAQWGNNSIAVRLSSHASVECAVDHAAASYVSTRIEALQQRALNAGRAARAAPVPASSRVPYGYDGSATASSLYEHDDSQDMYALCIERLVDTIVEYHALSTVKLGLTPPWDAQHYKQFVRLSTLIAPHLTADAYWCRSLAYSLWARLHLLFPISDASTALTEPCKASWRWRCSSADSHAWLERLQKATSQPRQSASDFALTGKVDNHASRSQRATPLTFHVSVATPSLELQVELLCSAHAAFQECLDGPGMAYIQVEMYQREAFCANIRVPLTSVAASALWARGKAVVGMMETSVLEDIVIDVHAQQHKLLAGLAHDVYVHPRHYTYDDPLPVGLDLFLDSWRASNVPEPAPVQPASSHANPVATQPVQSDEDDEARMQSEGWSLPSDDVYEDEDEDADVEEAGEAAAVPQPPAVAQVESAEAIPEPEAEYVSADAYGEMYHDDVVDDADAEQHGLPDEDEEEEEDAVYLHMLRDMDVVGSSDVFASTLKDAEELALPTAVADTEPEAEVRSEPAVEAEVAQAADVAVAAVPKDIEMGSEITASAAALVSTPEEVVVPVEPVAAPAPISTPAAADPAPVVPQPMSTSAAKMSLDDMDDTIIIFEDEDEDEFEDDEEELRAQIEAVRAAARARQEAAAIAATDKARGVAAAQPLGVAQQQLQELIEKQTSKPAAVSQAPAAATTAAPVTATPAAVATAAVPVAPVVGKGKLLISASAAAEEEDVDFEDEYFYEDEDEDVEVEIEPTATKKPAAA